MQRRAGVLLPLFSLPGAFGIGSLGKEATDFLSLLQEGGFSVWQMLPLCHPATGHSPYSAFSAFSYHPYYIDLPTLFDEGLLTKEELKSAEREENGCVDYEWLDKTRLPLLFRAASRYGEKEKVLAFLEKEPEIAAYCRFMAKREGKDTVYGYGFLQYTFRRQFDALHAAAKEKGVLLMGDMPIYVHGESADVEEHPTLFSLPDGNGEGEVAGVPPDMFSPDGQRWGNPLYRWDEMKKDGYAFFSRRLSHTLRDFDALRLDHFRGFASYYSIPANEPSAKKGVWKIGPRAPLIDAFRRVANGKPLIAEDLGDITPDVGELLAYSGFPCMRVLQFADPDDGASPHSPHNYGENTVAYTGTHDNNTLLGYLLSLSQRKRERLFQMCGYTGKNVDIGFYALLDYLFESAAAWVILPMQDVLRMGEEGRINRPGVPDGNWRFRFRQKELLRADMRAFHDLADIGNRLPTPQK